MLNISTDSAIGIIVVSAIGLVGSAVFKARSIKSRTNSATVLHPTVSDEANTSSFVHSDGELEGSFSNDDDQEVEVFNRENETQWMLDGLHNSSE